MPDHFYSLEINANNGTNKLVYFLLIDTIVLCDFNDTFSNYYFEMIEYELKKNSKIKIPYLIVVGHYPIWSIAEHGPTSCLVEKLRPILLKYKINAYFSGALFCAV
jgi:tartrate-resistant acid phosphatase type 5